MISSSSLNSGASTVKPINQYYEFIFYLQIVNLLCSLTPFGSNYFDYFQGWIERLVLKTSFIFFVIEKHLNFENSAIIAYSCMGYFSN